MAGPRGPRKRTLKPGARPEKPSKARAEIRAATVEPIPELESLPAPAAPVEIVVDSAPVIAPVSGGSSGRSAGALPRSKKKTPASVKAALERAVATSEGKEAPKLDTTGVDPSLIAAIEAKEHAEKMAEAVAAGAPVPAIKEAEFHPIRRGTEPTYTNEMPDIAKALCADGATDIELADFFKVSVRTIYRWKNEHLAFRHALVVGKDQADNAVERGLYQRAAGYIMPVEKVFQFQGQVMRVEMEEYVPSDVAAAKLWLANRRPEQWRADPDKGTSGSAAEQLGNMALMELARRMGMVLVAGMKAEEAVTLEARTDDSR